MAIKMILCTGMNGELGFEDKLLFRLPEDLALFKKKTAGNNVLMGRKTFDSLPFKNGLPQRKNFVLSRTPKKSGWNMDVVWLSHFNDRLVSMMHDGIFIHEDTDLWVIGGAEIYKAMEPYIDEIHWTLVGEEVVECDTYYNPVSCIIKNQLLDHSSTKLREGVHVHVYKKLPEG